LAGIRVQEGFHPLVISRPEPAALSVHAIAVKAGLHVKAGAGESSNQLVGVRDRERVVQWPVAAGSIHSAI
jgi:hypothetical protein